MRHFIRSIHASECQPGGCVEIGGDDPAFVTVGKCEFPPPITLTHTQRQAAFPIYRPGISESIVSQ